MSITAKELARILGLSPAAVSVALNNKPGVSNETRQRVLAAAKEYNYSSGTPHVRENVQRSISFVLFKKADGPVVDDTPFFSSLTEGIATCCRRHGFSMDMRYVYESRDTYAEVNELVASGTDGIILLATEMKTEDFAPFENISVPVVILDTYFENICRDYVLINNVQGAFLATDTLIKTRGTQPGYLRSSYPIGNFEERADGFYKALRRNNLSTSKSIVHTLSPSVEGSYNDMKKILSNGAEVANSYFADNDMIAIGAMRAFKEFGYNIPADIAIIGFDNAYTCDIINPPLTTINVPKQEMGQLAVERLIYIMNHNNASPVKTQLLTSLVRRSSL